MSGVFTQKKNMVKRRRRIKQVLTRNQKREVLNLIENKVENKIESKYVDIQYATGISNVPTISSLTSIGPGTGPNQRIGNKVELVSIQCKLLFALADATNYIRIVIFQWLEDAGSFPTWTDLFEFNTLGLPTTQVERMSPYTLSAGKQGSFRVLYQNELNLDNDNGLQQVKSYINKGFRKVIDFDTVLSTIGTGHLYVMVISDSSAAPHPSVNGYFRMRFKDA